MKRGKLTRRGMGSPSDPPGIDPPPTSGGGKRPTHRGMGDSQAPKLVTMHGVAPPSDSDRPPPPVPSLERKTLEFSTEDFNFHHDALPNFSEEETPVDHESDVMPPSEDRESLGEDRSRFRTAPGGGKNRVSGGRAAAAAYVSPSTLSPGHGTDPRVVPVEVADHVLREARSFQTEPSLARKRASHNPPAAVSLPVPPPARSRRPLVIGAGALLTLALVGGAWAVLRSTRALHEPGTTAPVIHNSPSTPAVPPSQAAAPSTAREVPSPTPSQADSGSVEHKDDLSPGQENEFRNQPPARPTTEHADQPSPSPAKKPSSNSKTRPTTKSRDLWLE